MHPLYKKRLPNLVVRRRERPTRIELWDDTHKELLDCWRLWKHNGEKIRAEIGSILEGQ